jgi:hypothetical protein
MKLLLITTIKEFEKNVKDLLHSGVSVFSYTAVKGYKADQKQLLTIGLPQKLPKAILLCLWHL